MLELADRVLRNMTASGKRVHNGLHLRIEGDAMAHGFVRGGKGGIKVCIDQMYLCWPRRKNFSTLQNLAIRSSRLYKAVDVPTVINDKLRSALQHSFWRRS